MNLSIMRPRSAHHRMLYRALALMLASTIAGCSASRTGTDEERVTGNDPLVASSANGSGSGPKLANESGSERLDSRVDDGTKELTNVSNGNAKVQEPKWDKKNPKLAGIAIGDQIAVLAKKLGTPIDSYEQNEKKQTLLIHEYDGFTIGFEPDQLGVFFIEVYDHAVVSGLSGLRVGDTEDKAVKALGKPDSQTPYLLTYETEHALLKLDLDPDSHEIVTIRLFKKS